MKDFFNSINLSHDHPYTLAVTKDFFNSINVAHDHPHTSLTSLMSRYRLRNTNAMFSQPMFCHRREDTLSMCDSNYHNGTSLQGRKKERTRKKE